MKLVILSWLAWSVAMAHSPSAPAPKLPKEKLTVLRTIPHSGYSEGLDFHGGYLWHSLPKEILKIDPKDGSIVQRFPPSSEYNESLTWLNGFLYMVSYSDNGIYKGKLQGDKFTFERVGTTPEIHAWGLTHDGKDLLLTGNYSRVIYRMDTKDFAIKSTVTADVTDVEDLAFDGKDLWSSSFTEYRGSIFKIAMKTGKIDTIYELPDPESCPVIDGIAIDGKTFWLTGKNCPSIFNVKIPTASRQITKK